MKAKINSGLLLILLVLSFTSCLIKHLVYIDEWEGKYTLWEHNSCCDDQKPVMLLLAKKERDKYEWKLYATDNTRKDTVYGEAKYIKNKLKFYIKNPAEGGAYFVDAILPGVPVFNMEYDNYSTEKEKLYIGYYTRWDNYLKGYKNGGSLFSGVSYHFKRIGDQDHTFELTKEELKKKKPTKTSN